MTSPPFDWTNVIAPSLDDFDRMANSAFAGLPEDFRQLCEGVIIRVEDFPDDATLKEMNCESEFELLGLFRGRGLAHGEASMATGQFPNMVWLYGALSWISGPMRTMRSATSSPMFSCMRSGTILDYPTRIWRRSKNAQGEPGRGLINGAAGESASIKVKLTTSG